MSECLTSIPCPLCGNGTLHAPPSLQAIEQAATKYFVIPRPQYEVLWREAQRFLSEMDEVPYCGCTKCQSAAALRSAGIGDAEQENDGGDPSIPELLKPRGNNGVVSADICRDAMLLTGTVRAHTLAEIAAWTQDDRDRVYDWAIRVHLAAGDNDGVFIPEMPSILRSAGIQIEDKT